MLIIGCDFHPGFQQVAIFDNTTGEIQERRLVAVAHKLATMLREDCTYAQLCRAMVPVNPSHSVVES
jgi:hypothetical protein